MFDFLTFEVFPTNDETAKQLILHYHRKIVIEVLR